MIVNDILLDPDTEVIYVGCGFSGGCAVPLYRSWDGGANWDAAFQGIPPKIFRLQDLWGFSTGDLIAVGYGPTIRHFSGDVFTEYDTDANSPGEMFELGAVWGSSPENVYAVGAGGCRFGCSTTGSDKAKQRVQR